MSYAFGFLSTLTRFDCTVCKLKTALFGVHSQKCTYLWLNLAKSKVRNSLMFINQPVETLHWPHHLNCMYTWNDTTWIRMHSIDSIKSRWVCVWNILELAANTTSSITYSHNKQTNKQINNRAATENKLTNVIDCYRSITWAVEANCLFVVFFAVEIRIDRTLILTVCWMNSGSDNYTLCECACDCV